MSRIFAALIAATVIGAAAPASAFSLQLNFPVLTYPTQTAPITTQACSDLTKPSGVTCTQPAK